MNIYVYMEIHLKSLKNKYEMHWKSKLKKLKNCSLVSKQNLYFIVFS